MRLHDLRHTAAYLWLQVGGESLDYVQRQLGHQSITTTQRYSHMERGHVSERATATDDKVWARHRERHPSS